jgi:hypothetical protein
MEAKPSVAPHWVTRVTTSSSSPTSGGPLAGLCGPLAAISDVAAEVCWACEI